MSVCEMNEDLHYTAENKNAGFLGRVPCVVQLPFQDYLDSIFKSREEYNIALAEFGVDWLKNVFETCDPDVLMGAGIEGFVSEPEIKKRGYTRVHPELLDNPDFRDFKDPKGIFDIYSCIPLVMVVDKMAAAGRELPKQFSDLLSPEYAHSIVFPDDGHMFDGIILTYVHQIAGDEGIIRLRENIHSIVHPSQMIKPGGVEGKPFIYVMPWIFGTIKARQAYMELIWFSDGAPILPVVVTSKNTPRAESMTEGLFSKKAGEIFRNDGFFPSNITDVDNRLPGKLRFVGWEYIYREDLPEIIARCKALISGKDPDSGTD